MTTTVGIIVGSPSDASINRRVARALAQLAPAGCTLVDLPISDLPIYNPDNDGAFAPAAARLKQQIEEVDGVVVVTPEYNRSVPAFLKNAIDYASRPWGESSWTGKPIAVIGTGLNPAGTAVAQAHLRSVLGACGAHVLGVPETCLHWSEELVAADGTPSAEVRDVLAAFLAATVDLVRERSGALTPSGAPAA